MKTVIEMAKQAGFTDGELSFMTTMFERFADERARMAEQPAPVQDEAWQAQQEENATYAIKCATDALEDMTAQGAPAAVRVAIVVNLVREGINKHRARELADHFIGLATTQPAQQEPNGIEFLMRGDKMAVKIGVQQFTLDYEPVEPGEFEFMRDMLLKALSAFTPDVKTEKPVYTSPQPAQRKPIDFSSAIQYADAPWSGVHVPIEWCRHFADALAEQPAPVQQQEHVAWYESVAELASVYGEMCAINETKRDDQTPEQIARLAHLRAECVAIHKKRITINTAFQQARKEEARCGL